MPTVTTQGKRSEKVKAIVREDLEGYFKDRFVFDPIVVREAVDEFGDGDGEVYLRIWVVYDGEQDLLDPNWTSGLISRIRPKLTEEGIEEFPSPSYVARSEWPSLAKQWQRRNPELKLDTP